jgi:hypothetical protein
VPNKRIFDGEAAPNSDKLAQCSRLAHAEYPWLLTEADCNGVFEFKLQQIWRDVYGTYRSYITVEDVEAIFEEYRKHGLVYIWTENGKQYAYWVGIEKPGRLPALSNRANDRRRLYVRGFTPVRDGKIGFHYDAAKQAEFFRDVEAYRQSCLNEPDDGNLTQIRAGDQGKDLPRGAHQEYRRPNGGHPGPTGRQYVTKNTI